MGGSLFNGLATEPQKVRGGPSWAYSDKYTIEAKAEGTPDQRVMLGPMLRTLLEERFQLKLHQELEQVPMYTLVVGKAGLKIKPMSPGGCIEREPGKSPTPGAMAVFQAAGKPVCGTLVGGHNGPNRTWVLGGYKSFEQLAFALSTDLNRVVIDRTGVTDIFNVQLEYVLDETTPGNRLPRAPVTPSAIPPAASIFDAVEQLGLKLEPIKGPRGYLVIDRLERPSPNLPAPVPPARAMGAGR